MGVQPNPAFKILGRRLKDAELRLEAWIMETCDQGEENHKIKDIVITITTETPLFE